MRTSANLFKQNNQPTECFAKLLKDLQIPGSMLTEIDAALQARFFQKKPGTKEPLERWELEKVTVTCSEHAIRGQLADVGFINKIAPTKKTYDRAGWPGALVTRAAERLRDLIEAWNSGVHWDETIVFSGKRPLQQLKENVVECCRALGMTVDENTWAQEYVQLWDKIRPETELDMMRFLWEAASLDKPCPEALALPTGLRKRPAIFVDAPMKPPATPCGKEVRPNTEDTIVAWDNQYTPTPGSMLVSSGAPYGMAQNETFWMLLGPKGHSIETFGHAVPEGLGLEVILRELAGCVNRIRRARNI